MQPESGQPEAPTPLARVLPAHSLARDATQLRVDRRIGVGLVVLLVTHRPNSHKPTLRQPCQFALDTARTHACQRDQLGRVKAAVRLPEQQAQDALLRAGKQSFRKGGPAGTRGKRRRVRTHFGHFNTQIGLMPAVISQDAALARTPATPGPPPPRPARIALLRSVRKRTRRRSAIADSSVAGQEPRMPLEAIAVAS